MASGQGRLTLDTVGSNSLVKAAVEAPRGKMKIGALEARVKQLELQAGSDGFSAHLAAASTAKGFSGLAFAEQDLSQVQLNVGAARAVLAQASIVAQSGTGNWQASGNAEAESLTASFANGEAGALKLDRAEIKTLQATAPLQLAADALEGTRGQLGNWVRSCPVTPMSIDSVHGQTVTYRVCRRSLPRHLTRGRAGRYFLE